MVNVVEVVVFYKIVVLKWLFSFDNFKVGVDKVRVFLFVLFRKYFSKWEICLYFFLKFFFGWYVGF